MSNIIPFSSNNLPAFLQKVDFSQLNSDLTAHASTGFPNISVKGKVFTIVRDGERTIVPNPKDPDSPATSIDVVIIKANGTKSKVFYAQGYQDGVEGAKPDCFSNDGSKPDASSTKPQAKSCATCPQNVWGSKIGENGGKGKACQDSVRLAIATPNLLNDPYLLRVPPASIKALGELGNVLKLRKVGYSMVVTKIGFDQKEATPKLVFKPVGFLDEDSYKQVQEMAESDIVKNILGSVFSENEVAAEAPAEVEKVIAKAKAVPVVSKSKEVSEEEITAAIETAVAQPAKAKTKASDFEVDLNLDDLEFDDE
jgi:hypothetical protein